MFISLSNLRRIHASGVLNKIDFFAAFLVSVGIVAFSLGWLSLFHPVGGVFVLLFVLLMLGSVFIEYRYSRRLIRFSPTLLLLFLGVMALVEHGLIWPWLSIWFLASAMVASMFMGMVYKVRELVKSARTFVVVHASYIAAMLAVVGYVYTGFAFFLLLLAITQVLLYGVFVFRKYKQRQMMRVDSAGLETARFCVYISAPPGSSYQLLMWLPYFDKLGEDYFVLVRERHLLLEIKEKCPLLNVVHEENLNVLQDYVFPSMRAVFYVNNACKNAHMIRLREVYHVLLLHGESEKPSSHNPMAAMYDYLYVAGQAAVDRYERHRVAIQPEKFRVIGRPQLEGLSKQIHHAHVVLYAPTWEGIAQTANYSSLYAATDIIKTLLSRGLKVIFRPHPLSVKQGEVRTILGEVGSWMGAESLDSALFEFSNPSDPADKGLFAAINESSYLVTDNSSVIVDYLYTNKPMAVVDVQADFFEATQSLHISQAAYLVDKALSNLNDVINDMLDSDPLRAQRELVSRHYLADELDSDGVLKFEREVLSLIEAKETLVK